MMHPDHKVEGEKCPAAGANGDTAKATVAKTALCPATTHRIAPMFPMRCPARDMTISYETGF